MNPTYGCPGVGPGRPTILTEAFIADFVAKLRVSGSIETAIQGTRISCTSFYGWRKQYRAGGGSPMLKRLMREVDKAESENKMFREQQLTKPGKNWRAIARWLERKYPNEYGRRRPLPLPDADSIEERRVDRITWMEDDDPA